jgi:two-component system, NtrC family, response regulator GlrR
VTDVIASARIATREKTRRSIKRAGVIERWSRLVPMPTRGGTQGVVGSHRALEPRASIEAIWDGAGHVSVAKVGLESMNGHDDGAGRILERERIVIGSHESSDFVVRDPTVSRMHCELIPARGCVVIRDLESKHGTSIHGIAIREATLTGTTVLQLGHARVRLIVGSDSVNLPVFDGTRLGRLVGQSPAMRRVFAVIERAAAADATVLIQGETGTGKTAVATTIHQLSTRAGAPMLVLDCAMPRELLESELFGHDPGAVGSTSAPRAGIFEAASGGSLLLDDVGELPIELQPRLLAVLERREVRRVGGSRALPVDVRVMAATRRSLAAEVNCHRFRSDLHHRLTDLQIALPPLRSRLEDLPLLVAELARRLRLGADERSWLESAPVVAELAARHWPDNVRELRSFLEACVAIRTPAVIDLDAVARAPGLAVDTGRPLHEARADWMALFDRAYATEVLRRHFGNVSAAALAAGLDRLAFYRLLWQLGIR